MSFCQRAVENDRFTPVPLFVAWHEVVTPNELTGRHPTVCGLLYFPFDVDQFRHDRSIGSPMPFSFRELTMATEHQRQEFAFQAEIKQLLHLLSHSLYQSREIAIRELLSNASDALDKMRFLTLTDETLRDQGPLEIVIEPREHEKRVIIRDNGIGMTHEEVVTNLGTIAHSGSGEFLKSLSNESKAKADLSLIGQFGVGFYSAFMIADRVQVQTRSHREEGGWVWESEG